jgi:hypothetical protein
LHHHGFPHRPALGGQCAADHSDRLHHGVGHQTNADPKRQRIADRE